MCIGAVNIYLTEFLLQMNMANFVKKVYLFCLSTGGRFARKLVYVLENGDLFELKKTKSNYSHHGSFQKFVEYGENLKNLFLILYYVQGSVV